MDDPPNPPASSGSKTFGIHKYNPEYCLGSGAQREDRRRGYEDKYEDDALGEELSDDARIWRVMLDEGRANDAAMLQRFRDHLDVDLVFAGLFSAVLTTFVAQTSQTPSDTGDTTIALLLELIAIQRAWANNPRVNDVTSFSLPPPSPTPSPWINRCWFLSLIFSLLAAFGAVVVRQWLQEYESDIIGAPKRRALVRHYRRVGLEKYKVHLIVPILPMLLHVSLLLFFVGLTLYVRQSDRSMSDGIIALTTIIYLVYLGTNILPVFRPQCPYRSPLSTGVHWAKSLVALLYALLPARLRTKALLPFFLRSLSSAASHVHALLMGIRVRLPVHLQSAFSTCAKTVKRRLERTYGILHDRLRSFREALKKSWKEVFKVPEAHEWEAVLDSSDTIIPDSLDSMIQASSDLSITPLVVQASSSLPIDLSNYGHFYSEDPRYKELLRHRVLPWFINALSTRRMVFNWAPGREIELQRMACVLLLIPLTWSDNVLWEEINTTQYHTCISRVLQALTSALLELLITPTSTTTDVATLSMTLLALGNRLDDLDCNSKLLQNGALFDSITAAYSSLPEPPSLAVLRLRPVIWRAALVYLRKCGRPMDEAQHFAIALWRSAYSEEPFPDVDDWRKEELATPTRLNLQEWLYLCPAWSEIVAIALYRLLCPRSCESHENLSLVDELSNASRLHMACHVIDSFVKEDSADGDAAFDLLVAQFTGLLLATLGYDSIDSALQIIRHSTASAAFKSAFLIRPVLPLAKFLKADERLPATFAASLLYFFVKLATAVEELHHQDKHLAGLDILLALDRHSKEYYDTLAEQIPITYLRPALEMVLRNPRLAVLEIWDGIVALLVTQLSKLTTLSDLPAYDMSWCLYLDALCVARANSEGIDKRFPDASRALHSTLLSLKSTYRETWKSELTVQLEEYCIPLAVAFALKSTHGCKALAEWVDDLPTLVQDPNSGLMVRVPSEARFGKDLNWYRHFTSDPDKYIHAPDRHDIWWLHISELVSFEEAVERMQRSDAKRAAKEPQQNSRGNGAEPDANDDAEGPGRELDQLEDQLGTGHTQNKISERLRTLGAWVATSFKGVGPFLVRIPGLRPLEGRDRSASMINVDVERDAGSSVAPDPERRGGNPPTPARESQGGQDDNTSIAVTEQSGGDPIPAWRWDSALDCLQAWFDEQAQDGEHGGDDERCRAAAVPHDQCDQVEGTGAREDAGSGWHASARGSHDAGRGGEQDRDSAQQRGDEQRQDGEHGQDGERGQDDERERDGEHGWDSEHGGVGQQIQDDEQVQAGQQGRSGDALPAWSNA
ncbi:hypothetical protein EV715DRAFT_297308 [Schizophyllum commune]